MYSRRKVIGQLDFGFQDLVSKVPGPEFIGDGLITVSRDVFKSTEFQRVMRSFQTNLLSKEFSHGLRVITRSESGRMHCHFAVALSFSTVGFDWASFEQAERWYRVYRTSGVREALTHYKYYTKQYRSSCEPLRDLNRKIQARAKRYGLGRVFILPVRKNTAALKYYLISNIPKKRQKRDKGLHFFSSWGLRKTGPFKVLTRQYFDYMFRLKTFSQGLHLTADNYSIVLKDILGNNWHWKCRDYIKYVTVLPEGLFLPPHLQDGYEELRKTVKQHLVRTDQYVPVRKTSAKA